MINAWLDAFGVNRVTPIIFFKKIGRYVTEYKAFRKLATDKKWPVKPDFPCLSDYEESSFGKPSHYMLQDISVAQMIHRKNPEKHVDCGSRIDGFVMHVAAFRKIEVLDIRPSNLKVENITFIQCDLTSESGTIKSDSVSCLHALEHFGLGRYGDPLDPDGWKAGLDSLQSILNPNGTLYLSVPIGRQRIAFNAHRVFEPITMVQEALQHGLILSRFLWMDDPEQMMEGELTATLNEQLKNMYFGCGIFVFNKM